MSALVLGRFRGVGRWFTTREPRRRGAVAWAGAAVALLLAVALVAVAGFPTGDATPAAVAPPGARVAVDEPVAGVTGVHVLLTVEAGELTAIVAYDTDKGWLGVDLEPVPAGTVAAWAATRGEGPVPSLSAVYGRAPGTLVEIEWADDETTRVMTERDGAYVAARQGRVAVNRVVVLDDGGGVVMEVTEL